jgi:hypothetical protein
VKELGGGVRYDYECDDQGEEIADLEMPVPEPPCDAEHLDDVAIMSVVPNHVDLELEFRTGWPPTATT